MEEKYLELIFETEEGKTARTRLDSPVEPVDSEAVNAAMDLIVQEGLFYSSSGDWVKKKGARIVTRTVEEIEISVDE